jgi:hypothetical protein
MSRPERITLSAAEGEASLARLAVSAPSRSDCEILAQVLRLYFWLMLTGEEATVSIRWLRPRLFGSRRTAKTPPESDASTSSSGLLGEGEGGGESASVEEDTASTSAMGDEKEAGALPIESPSKAQGGHRPGTGCLGAAAYADATRVECRHEEGAVGQRCPVCGQGNLYALPAGGEIRLDGQALLSAMHYALEKLRGSACGATFTAGLPAGVGEEQDTAPARAVLAVSRYALGVPGYRLQGDQAMLGGPVPDATQGDQIEVVGDCAYKVCEQMASEAAQGAGIFHDDTAVRIVALRKANRALGAAAHAQGFSTPNERPGMHTTALAVQMGEHTAILYSSSRRHAGDNLQGL